MSKSTEQSGDGRPRRRRKAKPVDRRVKLLRSHVAQIMEHADFDSIQIIATTYDVTGDDTPSGVTNGFSAGSGNLYARVMACVQWTRVNQ